MRRAGGSGCVRTGARCGAVVVDAAAMAGTEARNLGHAELQLEKQRAQLGQIRIAAGGVGGSLCCRCCGGRRFCGQAFHRHAAALHARPGLQAASPPHPRAAAQPQRLDACRNSAGRSLGHHRARRRTDGNRGSCRRESNDRRRGARLRNNLARFRASGRGGQRASR